MQENSNRTRYKSENEGEDEDGEKAKVESEVGHDKYIHAANTNEGAYVVLRMMGEGYSNAAFKIGHRVRKRQDNLGGP